MVNLLLEWRQKQNCTKRELLSLMGVLHHTCQVVRPGLTFLRQMIELSKVVKQPYHHLRLNTEFRSDLEWWILFLPRWNGVSMLTSLYSRPHTVSITSDASGSWGCGAFSSTNQWFQLQLPVEWASVHITVKELLPIVISSALWGHRWAGESVLAYTDIVNSGRSKDKLAMHLMRCLFFFMARGEYLLRATHVKGKENIAADALSRNRLSLFRMQVPADVERPTPIPPP